MTKEAVLKAAEDLPEEFHLDDLFKKLVLIEKVEEALASYKAGDYLSNEEMAAEIEKIKARHNRDAA